MTNYLQPVNGPVRWLATVALGLTTLLLALLVIFLAAIPLFAPNTTNEPTPTASNTIRVPDSRDIIATVRATWTACAPIPTMA